MLSRDPIESNVCGTFSYKEFTFRDQIDRTWYIYKKFFGILQDLCIFVKTLEN